ncbi:MAG: hypothetical protein ACRDOA_21090 [Streptosporangiaceae bacterium]
MPDPSLLRQLLDRQEITAVMAAYARWADLNQPEQQAAGAVGRDDRELPPLGRASGAPTRSAL